MPRVHILLDQQLLKATDHAARRMRRSRSALVRDALRVHLRELEMQAQEQRDREGYAKRRQTRREMLNWEAWESEAQFQ